MDIDDKKERVLQINDTDNVGIALQALRGGEDICVLGKRIRVLDAIAFGHKIALCSMEKGQQVLKYGVCIGSATEDIEPGRHVHTHNMKSNYLHQYTHNK